MVDVKVPVLAESISEATLLNWHKKQGDPVKRGENLIDIETDKVTLEVVALTDGVLSEILKKDGDLVKSDEIIAHIDTAGVKGKSADSSKSDRPVQQSLPVESTGEKSMETTKLSPAVRSLLAEHNLEAKHIPVSSSDGRLTKEDIVNYLNQDRTPETAGKTTRSTEPPPVETTERKAPEKVQEKPVEEQPETATEQPAQTADTDTDADGRPEERVAMTRLRQRTAERLLSAQHEHAILTTFNEVNMKPVMDLRARYKDVFEKSHKVKLGYMSFFTRAATEALKKFPLVNASIEGNDIIYHGYFDIGIAVSAPRGLVVPVIRDADTLSFAEIETKIIDFGQKARDSKLTIEDLSGGTFTITNGGIFGSMLSTPILNPPQSAILGMHKIQERPMVVNGEITVLPMMYLALSYDHRIIDGREAVQFLVTIKDFLEDPARLLLQL